jgi:hypothetical protein
MEQSMAKTSQQSVIDSSIRPNPGAEHHDEDDFLDDSDYTSFAEGANKESKRRDARRKIEIYWEKKRLKEQFEDFDESEFDF